MCSASNCKKDLGGIVYNLNMLVQNSSFFENYSNTQVKLFFFSPKVFFSLLLHSYHKDLKTSTAVSLTFSLALQIFMKIE